MVAFLQYLLVASVALARTTAAASPHETAIKPAPAPPAPAPPSMSVAFSAGFASDMVLQKEVGNAV